MPIGTVSKVKHDATRNYTYGYIEMGNTEYPFETPGDMKVKSGDSVSFDIARRTAKTSFAKGGVGAINVKKM